MLSFIYRFLQRRPRLQAAVNLLRGRHAIALNYPLRPRPRYGFGHPPHPQLHALISANMHYFETTLRKLLSYQSELLTLPSVLWHNDYLPALDAVALYSFTAQLKPRRYFEIGSGISTRFVRAAIDRHQLPTAITSIDPHPRRDIDAICHTIIRQPLEETDLTVFRQLAPGDMLFVDNSHQSFQNSDVTVFFLDILPNLPAGVLVGIHDILLPDDYPPSYAENYYSEQYLLAAYLLGGAQRIQIVLPSWFVSQQRELSPLINQLFSDPRFKNLDTHGSTFWLRLVNSKSLSLDM